jgi:hypothetical protein
MKSFASGYRVAALIVLNTLLLFVVMEVTADLAMLPWHATKYDRMLSENWPALQRAFPDYSRDDVMKLAQENLHVAQMSYAPWVQFRTPPVQGRFINTAGQRRSNGRDDGWRSAMPDDQHFDVYFFGGSTMFGYGVADGDTMPAAFQKLAPAGWKARAFNYGQPFYYSRQETLLFEQLLRAGHHPDAAVFLDGLNDSVQPGASYQREPFFTPLLQRRMAGSIDWSSLLLNLGVTRALKTIGLAPAPETAFAGYYALPKGVSADAVAKSIFESYLENRQFTQMLCDHYGVKCLFLWQPIPMVKYHAPQDTLSMQVPSDHVTSIYARIASAQPRPVNFLDLQDSAAAFSGQPYVDSFHYSPGFLRVLAQKTIDYFAVGAVSPH